MSLFKGFNISASGLTAQRVRMDIIANNIANVETTRTPEGGPYRRQIPVFMPREGIVQGAGGEGVRVTAIIKDYSPFKMVYDPQHPDADEEGYLLLPNVELVKEMVDMIDASRAYEANVTAFNTTKEMARKALEIGRR